MAKRFTDSNKWDDPWFYDLETNMKCFWLYMLDKCDHGGVFKVNLSLASHYLGYTYDITKVTEALGDRIQVLNGGSRWFIPKFLDFQYGLPLNPKSKIHMGAINSLERVSKGLSKPYQRAMDKDKDKDIVSNMGVYKEITDDLNTVIGSRFLPTSTKNQELIKARMNEGHKIADFKAIHRKKFKEWSQDSKMKKYLRPETLWQASKFDRYVNEPEKPGKKVWDE